MLGEINIFFTSFSLFLFFLISYQSFRRGHAFILLVSVEYFYFLGLLIFPLLYFTGVIERSELLNGYLSNNGSFNFFTPVHIFCYFVGAVFGYFFFNGRKSYLSDALRRAALKISFDSIFWFGFLVFVGVFFSFLFFYLSGFEEALKSASAVRRGDVSASAEGESYLFLKRLVMLSTLLVVFVPGYLHLTGRSSNVIFWSLVISVLIFLQTVGRTIFVEVFFVSLCFVYAFSSSRKRFLLKVLFLSLLPVAYAFLFYGKQMVFYALSLITDTKFDFVSNDGESLTNVFDQFSHLYLSVDAGLKHFYHNGLLIPYDTIYAAWGFVPSSFFRYFGIIEYNYQFLDVVDRLSCVNSSYFFGYYYCTVPPYYTGYSAYLFPFLGAFVFGFLKYFIFSVLEKNWGQSDCSCWWLSSFVFLLFCKFSTFISNVVAFNMFIVLLFIFIVLTKLLLLKASKYG